jgi:hypothetical protein
MLMHLPMLSDRTESSMNIIFAMARSNLMQSASTKFATTFDPQRFPFDRQKLAAAGVVGGEDQDQVMLDNLDFSASASDRKRDRWGLGLARFNLVGPGHGHRAVAGGDGVSSG